MGGDRQFFSNETAGFRSDWDGFSANIAADAILEYSRIFNVPEEDRYFLQYRTHYDLKITAYGLSYQSGKSLLLHNEIPELPLQLKKGNNTIQIRIQNPTGQAIPGDFSARLISENGTIVFQETWLPLPAQQVPSKSISEPDLEGFRPATGAAYKSCGRFGYTKGDGILDCSMAAFGMITKPYVSGHPNARKNMLWHLSLLPEGEAHPCSLNENYQPEAGETIQVDWSGVRWSRMLQNGERMTFDYSLLTPEILMETTAKTLHLNELQNFAAYERITLPLEAGCRTRTYSDGLFYDRSKDGPLKQNWLLFSHSGSFPEIPLQMIFRETPEKITLRCNATGKKTGILLEFADKVVWAMLVFPFGLELFSPEQLDEPWYERAILRCAKRQQFALARPITCEDWFQADSHKVDIRQKFTYRYLQDSKNTPALTTAPLPPPLAIANGEVPELQLDQRAISLDFPSKYGPLYGVIGSSWSSYSLPIPNPRRDLSFAADSAKTLSNMISQDFPDFLSYHLDAPEILNPGNYSFVFQYSFVLMIFHLLKKEEKNKLLTTIRSGLEKVCNPDYQYRGPGGRQCCSWYKRSEPFSKVSYYSTYLHVGGISRYPNADRETIENSKFPFIEIDWGNAMSLYGTWLGTLFTDSWALIDENWPVLRKAFDYYLVMMDWACMTTAYAENGISWNDGTNYGGYLGFLNMAEILEKEEDLALARYAYAKMFAMRMGLFYSAQKYFCHFFGVPPYRTSKFFHEELDATRAFQNYPADILYQGYRNQSLYNMTTEGHYLETWNAYCHYMPDEVKRLLSAVEKANPEDSIIGPRPPGTENLYHTTGRVLGWQEVMTYLMLCFISRRYDRDTLLKMLREAADNKRIAQEFLGHIQWSRRRVPAAWTYVYLYSMFHGQDKSSLTAWRNLIIEHAAYPKLEVSLTRPNGWLEFHAAKTPRVYLNNTPLTVQLYTDNIYRVQVAASGTLRFEE